MDMHLIEEKETLAANKAVVNNIIKFSSVDGPGNRMVIFFQGCNFNCLYCHNPETINICGLCGACEAACPTQSISIDKTLHYNESTCVHCHKCESACNNLSSPKTKEYTAESLFLEVKKVAPFIRGITVSGGECTLQKDFLVEFFKLVKTLSLSIFVDTNGSLDLSSSDFVEFNSLVDYYMLDVKEVDSEAHKRLTGVDNFPVLKNLEFLRDLGKLYEVRTVLVEDFLYLNTVNYVIDKIIDFNILYKIISYRPHGVRSEFLERGLLKNYQFPEEKLKEVKELLVKKNFKNYVIK